MVVAILIASPYTWIAFAVVAVVGYAYRGWRRRR